MAVILLAQLQHAAGDRFCLHVAREVFIIPRNYQQLLALDVVEKNCALSAFPDGLQEDFWGDGVIALALTADQRESPTLHRVHSPAP